MNPFLHETKTSVNKNSVKSIENSAILVKENSKLSSEITSLKSKIKDYETMEKELNNFQKENKFLKEEINSLQIRQSKENEFNEVLKEFETNFRNKIFEVEQEKEYYKNLSKQHMAEKADLKYEKDQKIFELENQVLEITEQLISMKEKLAFFQEANNNSQEESIKINELKNENSKILMNLTEKDIELSVWKEKYYELLESKDNSASQTKLKSSILDDQKNEINSLKIQIKELLDKMDILNGIIETYETQKEKLETELKIYKQNIQETGKTQVYEIYQKIIIINYFVFI